MAPEISCGGESFEIEGNIIVNEDKIDGVTTIVVNKANDCYRLRGLGSAHKEEDICLHSSGTEGKILVNNVSVVDKSIPFDRFVIYKFLER